MVMKTCIECGETKPLSKFYACRGMADGHLNKCAECSKADHKRYYRSRRKQILARLQKVRDAKRADRAKRVTAPKGCKPVREIKRIGICPVPRCGLSIFDDGKPHECAA